VADTVFLLGAGVNRGIRSLDGLRQPPLSTDFFQHALGGGRTATEAYRQKLAPLFEYIARYWKLSLEDLQRQPFDLEACYTLLELQSREHRARDNREELVRLAEIRFRLTALLAEYLSDFEYAGVLKDSFRRFSAFILAGKAAVLTFNYDTILEAAIELASGVNAAMPPSFRGGPPESGEVPEEELPYSHCNWNRPLAYGVRFDRVQLQRAGLTTLVPGARFYAHPANAIYPTPFLKLHGSVNWFFNTGVPRFPFVERTQPPPNVGETVLYRPSWWFNEPPDLGGYILDPILLTPGITKLLEQHAMIEAIWERARTELAACRRLIVGGYSFPPTDFHARRLFLEAFQDRSPDEVTVINPDTGVVQIVKDLCHFKRPVLACRDVDEFCSLLPGSLT